MSRPVHRKTPPKTPLETAPAMRVGWHVPARGSGWLVRCAGLGAAALVLMLAPASSQMRGPSSVAPVAEKLGTGSSLQLLECRIHSRQGYQTPHFCL